jgi:hypothetical protein
MLCDIQSGPVTVVSEDLSCNGSNQTWNDVIFVTGDSSRFSVSISGSEVTLVFVDVNVSGSPPVSISSCSVVLVSVGVNRFVSTSSVSAGIECSSGSNVTLQGVEDGSFFAVGGSFSAGVGAGGNGTCGGLDIVNGSVDAENGLGSGCGGYGSHSILSRLMIRSGQVRTIGASRKNGDFLNGLFSVT